MRGQAIMLSVQFSSFYFAISLKKEKYINIKFIKFEIKWHGSS